MEYILLIYIYQFINYMRQQEREQHLQSLREQLAVTYWLHLFGFVVIFAVAFFFAIIASIYSIALVSMGLYGSMLLADQHSICAAVFKAGIENHTFNTCLTTVNFIEDAIIMTLTLAQFAISLWDYMVPIITYLIVLVIEIAMVVMKFIFGTALREPAMAMANFGVQVLRILINVANQYTGSSPTLGTTVGVGTGGDFGTVGAGISADTVQQFVKILQVIVVRLAKFFEVIGDGIWTFIDTMIMLSKYIGAFVKSIANILNMFDSTKGVGKFMFSMLDMHYAQAEVSYDACLVQYNTIATVCSIQDAIAMAFKGIAGALHPLCNCHIKVPSGCNHKKLEKNKCKKPKKNPVKGGGSSVGVGICDATVCTDATIDIIDLIQLELPSCDDWKPNSTSAVSCMGIVANYSITNSLNSASQIDVMAKELCFVLSTQITSQCLLSLPPFAFSVEGTAYDICVADKSGLSPPLAPFNERCACVYDQPLCPSDCCDQYSRHVIGQIQATVGGKQCNAILTEFPRDFWCQFESATSDTLLPVSDYTFSSVWCNAYLKYVKPICTLEPYWILGSLPPVVTTPYSNSFLSSTCSSISNQTGVCLPYNATISTDIYDLRHNQVLGSIDTVYDANNANSFTSGFIINVPTSATPVEDIPTLFLNRFICQQLALKYNNSVYKYSTSRARGVNASISRYCDQQLNIAYMSYTLQQLTDGKTLSTEGDVLPVDVPGIPVGTELFGANNPPASTPSDIACPSSTGDSTLELSNTHSCSTQSQTNSLDTLDSTTTDANTALNQMETNSIVAAPTVHFSSFTTLDPSDPNYAVQQQESDTLNQATQLNSNVNYGTSATDPPMTTTYVEWAPHERPPTSGPHTNNPVYLRINQHGQRVALGINDNKDNEVVWSEKVKQLRDQLSLAKAEGTNLFRSLFNQINTDIERDSAKTRRLKAAVEADMRDVKLGNSRVGHDNFMRRTRRLLSRGILVSTGNPDLDAEINQQLIDLGNPNTAANDSGITPNAFSAYFSAEKKAEIDKLLTFLQNRLGPRISNLFWGLIETGTVGGGNDGFVGKAPAGCHNTVNNPYDCCQGDVSPSECCKGLIGCLPLLTDVFFPTRTTKETVNRWQCERFNTAWGYWFNGARATFTWGVIFVSSVFGQFGGTIRTVCSFVAFDNYVVPDNSLGCMIWLVKYVFILGWILVLFLCFRTALIASYMLRRVREKYNKIQAEAENIEVNEAAA